MEQDKYGVVPYFTQLEDVVEVLGHGRCGEVKKIRWRGEFAALKEFQLDPFEHGRHGSEAFEHE